MVKPFLIIQLRPEDETADNELEKICEYGALDPGSTSRVRIERSGLPALDLDDYAGIIVGGSPFDVSTPEAQKSPEQLAVESGFRPLFEAILKRDFPFLGCCSGNGLLGNYLGTNISTRYGEAVGLVEVSLTESGRQDPLLQGFPDRFKVLTGHKEACDGVPDGARLLLSGEQCPVQMFRVRSNVYATQFHPEGDAEGFGVRINVYRNHGYFPPESAARIKQAVAAERTPHAHAILRNFVARFRHSH